MQVNNMTWKDILKQDKIEKGIMDMFRRMRLPKESKVALSSFKNGIKQGLQDVKQGGNLIIQSAPNKTTGYNNGTLVVGGDLLGNTDPKQFLEQVKQMSEMSALEIKDSSISGIPSLTVKEFSRSIPIGNKDFDY